MCERPLLAGKQIVRHFVCLSEVSVLGTPTGDTHITSDMCMGIHISRGYTYHCDIGAIFFLRNKIGSDTWKFNLSALYLKNGQYFKMVLKCYKLKLHLKRVQSN